MTRYRVVKAYDAAYEDPVVLRRGRKFRFERRESEWPGWVWCTDREGQSAWIPEAWVRIEGDRCVLVRDYSSIEMTVREGDIVSGNLIESGWLWATDAQGRNGWVPLECLEAT